MEPWLTRTDFDEFIGDIPPTFELHDHLSAVVRNVVRTWFAELIGEPKVNELSRILVALRPTTNGSTPLYGYPFVLGAEPISVSDANKLWLNTAVPFLCYAVWSQYIIRGNVTITETGPVTVLSDGSEPISDSQRAQLSRYYHGLAETYALKLRKLTVTDSCRNPSRGSMRPSLKSAGGKRKSRFD